MKKLLKKLERYLSLVICFLLFILVISSCKKNTAVVPSLNQIFTQVNLVASSSSFAGARVDPNLVNGWGLSFSSTGTAWVSSAGMHTSVVYDKAGVQKLAPVTIPSSSAATGGTPTGQVFNSTADFVLPTGGSAKFIFAGADGIISAWNGGTGAVKMIDRSTTSSYLGLTMGVNGSNNFLYASNFKSGKIDVFDKNFALVSMPFTDPGLPAGYAPFNIQNVGGLLYVMYAKINTATFFEIKGAGLGYVDIYNTDGSFVKRFVSQGQLNAPYGIAQAPSTFLASGTSAILIGNFGDGRVNAYDQTGNFLGSITVNGTDLVIDGLWGITFAPATATTIDPNWLFFAAGPAGETQGLFGYISK